MCCFGSNHRRRCIKDSRRILITNCTHWVCYFFKVGALYLDNEMDIVANTAPSSSTVVHIFTNFILVVLHICHCFMIIWMFGCLGLVMSSLVLPIDDVEGMSYGLHKGTRKSKKHWRGEAKQWRLGCGRTSKGPNKL